MKDLEEQLKSLRRQGEMPKKEAKSESPERAVWPSEETNVVTEEYHKLIY